MSDYENTLKELEKKFPEILAEAVEDKHKRILASFYSLAKFNSSNVKPEILKHAFNLSKSYEPRNLNDFYTLLLLATKSNSTLIKNAYPQYPLILSDNYDEEFNLDKWAKLVYKIYDAVLSKDMTLDHAIDYYAGTLDKKSQEDFKFTKWIKSHLSGDKRKYAKGNSDMKKQSNYQFGLNSSNFYYPDSVPIPEKEEMPVTKKMDNEVDNVKRKEQLRSWKAKIDGAIRRIDKLIRTVDVDPEMSAELFNSLHNFNMAVHNIKSKLTASDITYRTANSFKKVGFDQGYDILVKTAQEVEDSIDEFDTTPEESQDDLRGEMAGEPAAVPMPAEELPRGAAEPESEDPVTRVYENTSGAKEGEYEKLSQDVGLEDAIAKLEEVAARLADRRVVRLLAEFDIMLDKLGIAAMFPELAESQSKLIDAYSYSMVRTTKMLGMLSSGKSLTDIAQGRKEKMTGDVRKDVDKELRAPDPAPPPKEEAIAEEFAEPAAQPEATPEAPPATPEV